MKSLIAFTALAAVSAAWGQVAEIKVENPWIFAVPPGAADTAAFMTLVNTGTVAVRLTGAEGDVARRLAPMITTREDGRLGMKDVSFIEVPAGGKAVLKPGGDHLMLYGLKKPLQTGDRVALTLTFDRGGKLPVEAVVSKREPKVP